MDALAFSPKTVDASSGRATGSLNWTITNSNDRFKSSVLTATESVDSTPATYDQLEFDFNTRTARRPFVYDSGAPATVVYSLRNQDFQSGFWKGSIAVTGPGGAVLNADFQFTDPLGEARCGLYSGGGGMQNPLCSATLTIPTSNTDGTFSIPIRVLRARRAAG